MERFKMIRNFRKSKWSLFELNSGDIFFDVDQNGVISTWNKFEKDKFLIYISFLRRILNTKIFRN